MEREKRIKKNTELVALSLPKTFPPNTYQHNQHDVQSPNSSRCLRTVSSFAFSTSIPIASFFFEANSWGEPSALSGATSKREEENERAE